MNTQLDKLLDRPGGTRRHFNGLTTYVVGLWEGADWTGFDFVGVNYYRMAYSSAEYVTVLRTHLRLEKPVLMTEFGELPGPAVGPLHRRGRTRGLRLRVHRHPSRTPPTRLDVAQRYGRTVTSIASE
ncbi:hypothetical protein [Streptomyces sp. NP10]|uniref:hypothetical protein n=1 Tax=Streptomyces sp. NP10 TaxID=1141731 RepID=UPI000F88AB0C|nr:hypothetical protein [Streptomyces sp. NP10]